MGPLDRKFKIVAFSVESGKKYTDHNGVLFLAKDKLLPRLLEKYIELCEENKVDERQIKGIELLKERVEIWQEKNLLKVKLPDVKVGKEEKRVCKSNF